jgi:hypothetical protein
MMRTGSEPCRGTERVGFKIGTANAQRSAVAKDENVRARVRLALPELLACPKFIGGLNGCCQLPLAELFTEGGQGIGLSSDCGVVAPCVEESSTRVFTMLHGGPVRKCAAVGAGGFGKLHLGS